MGVDKLNKLSEWLHHKDYIGFNDEGHRGASGEDWLDKREQLCEHGFSYEYSATFEQAIAGASKSKNKETNVSPQQRLTQLYAKCILLDYSYRYFYNDDFGKDSHILNLEESKKQEQQRQYLTACMMAFFQQRLLFKDEAPIKLSVFNLWAGASQNNTSDQYRLSRNLLADRPTNCWVRAARKS